MIIDGKKERDIILDKLKKRIDENNLKIKLAIIEVGGYPANLIYIKNKVKACEKVGIQVLQFNMDSNTTEEELINLVIKLNNDATVTGIIIQSPVPNHIDFSKCCNLIDASKDVDGFTRDNIYNLYLNKETILPCTVKGIIYLLDRYNIPLKGANVVIVGRGNIVGRPLAIALLNRDATVTIAHSRTNNLQDVTKNADILIAAAGYPHLITGDMVKDGATVIDVGVSRVNDKVVGDIDYENVSKHVKYITPNPGGVGPMTVAMILDNLVEMAEGKK